MSSETSNIGTKRRIPGKRGPKTPSGKAKSLANLKQPWGDGNPPPRQPGRTSLGLSVKEWMNHMQSWSMQDLDKAMGDDSPSNVAIAARCVFHSRSRELNASGMPIAGADFDRVMDQTAGKPKQTIDLTMEGNHKIETHKAMSHVMSDQAAYDLAVLLADKINAVVPADEPKADAGDSATGTP